MEFPAVKKAESKLLSSLGPFMNFFDDPIKKKKSKHFKKIDTLCLRYWTAISTLVVHMATA